MIKEEVYLEFIKYTFILLVITILLYIYLEIKRNYDLKKRFDNITAKSINQKDTSLRSGINSIIQKFDLLLINIFSKVKLIEEYSFKYEIYSSINKNNNILTFVRKVEVGFLVACTYLVACILELSHFSLSLFLVIFVLSSYLLEISLHVRYKKRNIEIKNDLNNAVSILTKSFKAGKTTTQSINFLIKELDGPLKEEFKVVKQDLETGLGLAESFDRMNKRTNIEDLKYIASSLSLLSVTGGNIVKVFEMIEGELLSRKKLEDEFNSLTASSKLMYKILLVLPLVIIISMTVLNKDFFLPLVSSFVGIMILTVVVSLYILYIFIIKKILKVVL